MMILDVNIGRRGTIFTKFQFFHPTNKEFKHKIYTTLRATDDSGKIHVFERVSKNSSSSRNIEKILLLQDCGFTYNKSSLVLENKIKSLGGWNKYLRDIERYYDITYSEVFRRDLKAYRKSKKKLEHLKSKYEYKNLKYLNLTQKQKESIIKTIK